jgi:hypothetical protein
MGQCDGDEAMTTIIISNEPGGREKSLTNLWLHGVADIDYFGSLKRPYTATIKAKCAYVIMVSHHDGDLGGMFTPPSLPLQLLGLPPPLPPPGDEYGDAEEVLDEEDGDGGEMQQRVREGGEEEGGGGGEGEGVGAGVGGAEGHPGTRTMQTRCCCARPRQQQPQLKAPESAVAVL